MRAGCRVKAALVQHQPPDWVSANEVFLDNLGDVLRLHESVPDCLRVHDHCRSVLALVQATGLVGANAGTQSCCLDLVLEEGVQHALAISGTRRPGSVRLPVIGAYENVAFKPGQAAISGLLFVPLLRLPPKATQGEFPTCKLLA
jgi:hypothetical protein